ncbi:hypothetical protein GFS31_05960 [Leptolyngbya sp. BL0902]|uniref:hypothetical protein n=1 Tax=Leptolyngbya sp. BL0902 TaxID=1115757 RepID=UPI0018E83728|nr:hypothetical protein [Leptolyngbya sp. BL0902]QQE63925.1 hypothetical protein GFS31_05960 [Leptolyngbya sp. BL0902]
MTGSQFEPWQPPEGDDGASLAGGPGSMAGANAEAASQAAMALTLTPPPSGVPRRSWRQRLGLGAAVLAMGGIGYGLWAWWLRPPLRPYVLDFAPSASQYAVAAQQAPLLNWQISHPRQVETLVVRTLTAEGALVGEPKTYDLAGTGSSSLPVDLLAYCSQTRQRLSCENVPTQLREPGQYRFEVTLLPKASLNLPPIQATSSLVTITQRPMPVAIELVPQQVIYSEAGTPVSANQPTLAPPVTGNGIELSWIVTHPQALQDLLLVVRKPGGTTVGGRRFSLRNPENPTLLTLPEELQPFCQIGEYLVCQGVPTGMGQVGQYQFELTPIPVGLADTETPPVKVSEVVEVQPRPLAITAFRINGQEADPKYLVPVEPGQPIPGFQLDWQVEGGSTAQVELLPSPGTVGRSGSLRLPLPPSGSTTLTLRVSDGHHPPVVRAVTFETFNPNPNPPIILNPEALRPNSPSPPAAQPSPQPSAQAPRSPAAPSPPPDPRPRPNPPSPPALRLPEPTAPPATLPEDLRNRPLEDLNLQF